MSLKSKLKLRKPNHADIPFCLDRPLVEEYRLAENAVHQAKKPEGAAYGGKSKDLVSAEKALKDLGKQVKEATVTIRLTSVAWERYTALMLEHPAREGKSEQFNFETFFIALARETAAEVTDSGSTVPIHDEEWDEFIAGLTDGEHDYLAETLIALNRSNLTVNTAPLA